MEPNFQTSFIPKKPIVEKRAKPARSVGVFAIISIFILFTILLTSVGLYFYKSSLEKSLSEKGDTLISARNRFEPAKITELKLLDKRLRASSKVLAGHVAITPIFQALQDITMKTVRFTKFSYDTGSSKSGANTSNSKTITVKMSGQAVGYRSVALQSDLLAKNKNFIDPVFSNLSLDDKGNVLFDLEFSVDPSFVNYKQMLQVES